MSLDRARACLEKMKTDRAFCDKILAIEGVAERIELIKAEGFACTRDEIETVWMELTDADLEGVAGGGTQPSPTVAPTDCSCKGRTSWPCWSPGYGCRS